MLISQNVFPVKISPIPFKSILSFSFFCRQATASVSIDDQLSMLISKQKEIDFIKGISITKNAYFVYLYNSRQILDVEQFCCCSTNPVPLGVDTTFNLCDLWLTDTSYRNQRLSKISDGKNPVFLGPSMFHFTKNIDTFSRFFLGVEGWQSGT